MKVKNILMILVIVFIGICIFNTNTVFAGDESTLAGLQDAISGGDTDITITAIITIPNGETVNIPNGVTLNMRDRNSKLVVEPGGTLTVNGNTLVGKTSDSNAVLQLTEGEVVYSLADFDDFMWVFMEGKAIANKDITIANGIEYFIISNILPNNDNEMSVLTVSKAITISVATEVRGIIYVTDTGTLTGEISPTIYTDKPLLKLRDVDEEDFAGGGRIEVITGGKLIHNGSILFGSDTNSIFQIKSGSAFIGAAPFFEGNWVSIDGDVVANKVIPTDIVPYIVINNKLTVKDGIILPDVEIRGILVQGNTTQISGGVDVGNTTLPTGDIIDVISIADTDNVKMDIRLFDDVDAILIEKSVFDEAKAKNKNLIFEVKNIKGEVLYTWIFDSSKLKNNGNTMDVNLSIELAGTLPKELPNSDKTLLITFNHDGNLPTTEASVKIYVGGNGYAKGDVVSFYYYNETTKSYELVSENLVVDAEGYVTVKLTHCSDYVLAKMAKTSSEKDNTYKMGSVAPIYYLVGIAVISALGIIVFRKKQIV